MEERLQKYMARCGLASRRECEKIISQGKVTVNGKLILEMGKKINPSKDEIKVEGRLIVPETKKAYIILNKPVGYISTVSDPMGRPTILELIGDIGLRIFPVGRLDFDSQGLIILTNDGDFTYYLTHPKHGIKKEYRVLVSGSPKNEDIESLKRGINIDDYFTNPAEIININKEDGGSIFKVIINEGRNRQVRRMFDSIGHPVISLTRVSVGNITLGNLPLGSWRYLRQDEVDGIKGMIKYG